MKNFLKNRLVLTLGFISIVASLLAQKPILHNSLGHSSDIRSVCYSPDGKYILSGSSDKTVKLWDVASGNEIKTFIGHGSSVSSVCFTPDGKYALSGGYDKTLILWEIATGKKVRTFLGHKDYIYTISISPDGKQAVSGGSGKEIFVWDIASANKINVLNKHTESINSICFSPNGEYFASGSYDKTIKIWKVANGKIEKSFQAENSINSVCFSPDGKFLVSVERGYGKTVKLWSLDQKKVIKIFDHKFSNANSAHFSPDGKQVVVGGGYGDGHLFDVASGNLVRKFNMDKSSSIHSVHFSPDGRHIVSGDSKTINIWEISSSEKVMECKGQAIYATAYDFSSDGNYAVFASDDTILRLWELASSKMKIIKTGKSENITTLALSPDSKMVAAGFGSGKVFLYEIPSGKFMKLFAGHPKGVASLSFSPDGKKLLSGGFDFNIKVWDLETGKETKNIKTNSSAFASFSPDGKHILSYDRNGYELIQLWHSETTEKTNSYNDQSVRAFFGCFSPDGKYILTAHMGENYNVLNIWDIFTGNKIRSFSNQQNRISSICFSPDGNTVFAGSSNNRIIAWSVTSGERMGEFSGHMNGITSLRFLPNSKILISNSLDKSIKFWDINQRVDMVSITVVDSLDWVVTTPSDRFDGTENGVKQLFLLNDMEVIPLESLYEQRFTPNLMRIVLNGGVLNPVARDEKLTPKPVVKIISPENYSSQSQEILKITVRATDMGGGIDEVRLYHNGKLLDGTTRGFKSTGQNHEFTVTLTNGENRIKATAFNSQRTESIPDEIVVNYKAPEIVKPNMHILAVGINNYLNPKYNLNYAKNDADAFVKSLSSGASTLFGKVEVTEINDANATKTGILAAIEKIKATAKAEDVFVFYYAGHGVMSTGNGVEKPIFYLVPHDVTKMYEADEMLKKSGISATEIGEFSKTIKAQKQLFVIDACQSGGAMQTLAMRGAAEEKAIAQLARSTGTYFIAASGTEQFATEVAELGHGIFTYSVIEALKGSCKSQDGKVTVNQLKSCVEDLVPELSKKHKGQPQFPTGYGFGMDFPVVMVK
jgi:WD40 repeat protein